MIGLMDKGGQGGQQSPVTPGQQMPSQQQGMPLQGLGAGLAQLFANSQPAVAQSAQTQIPQITAPQYGPSLMPSPEQAAAETRARMLARTPIAAAPVAQPKRQTFSSRGGEGGGARGASSGGNGNGWGGR